MEAMQEDLAKLLLDPSIDVTLKRALYEDLINRISRFKEDTQKTKTPTTAAPIVKVEPIPQYDASMFGDSMPPTAAPSTESVTQASSVSSSAMDLATAEPQSRVTVSKKTKSRKKEQTSPYVDADGFQTPKHIVKKEERKKRRPNQVSPASQITSSRTRGGKSFTDKELEANRRLGRPSDWGNLQSRQTMSPSIGRRPSMVQAQPWKS